MKNILIILFFFCSISITAQEKASIKFELLPFSNKKFNDFAPTLYKDGILFVSDRDNSFKDLYYYDNKSLPKKIKIDNQKFFVGSAFYDSNTEIIYVTKNCDSKYGTTNNRYQYTTKPYQMNTGIKKHGSKPNCNKVIVKKPINFAVYQGIIKNNKITIIKKLDFCKPEFSYGYPYILDNRLLISTDENGIFSLKMYRWKNYKWNFQKIIFKDKNPILNPIFKNKNTVLFASKRKGGLGGFDLYEIKYKNGKWSEPKNLKKFNTKFDDLSILFTKDNEGYISSNRLDNKDHIFKFKIK